MLKINMVIIMIKYFMIIFLTFVLNNLILVTHLNSESKDIETITINKKVVYLTFDDGPSNNTKTIMNILKDYNIKATFFVVGYNIKNQNETILKQLIENKHYIGMHTMSHNYNFLYRQKNASNNFINEIIEEQKLIFKITGLQSTLIRPPYSDGKIFSNDYMDDIINLNIKQWDWNIDSQDWNSKTNEEVMKNISYSLSILDNRDSLVVLFHELNITVKVLPIVIEFFIQSGYEFAAYDPKNHFPLNFNNNPKI
ncbi:MAG: polysaccharide deacetylase [Haloplasmataceae bacterium]|jgi:peptidoglycan/xylan/chitin deacetylase (PgdA/CDA1 family)|nr:polysaccharide deacetylase [Haloplasmataceae bacterium]